MKPMMIEIFWEHGTIENIVDGVLLRKVEEQDKEAFLELQRENALIPFMFNDDKFKETLWEEHRNETALMCTIIYESKYVGYCGIKDTRKDKWEISIEILKKYSNKGIGYRSINILLRAIKERLGVTRFRVRIEPDNEASQRLFEKLGATPNGISELLLHGEQMDKFEEENLNLLDDRLIELADEFGVEPRKMLSCVLEYEIQLDLY